MDEEQNQYLIVPAEENTVKIEFPSSSKTESVLPTKRRRQISDDIQEAKSFKSSSETVPKPPLDVLPEEFLFSFKTSPISTLIAPNEKKEIPKLTQELSGEKLPGLSGFVGKTFVPVTGPNKVIIDRIINKHFSSSETPSSLPPIAPNERKKKSKLRQEMVEPEFLDWTGLVGMEFATDTNKNINDGLTNELPSSPETSPLLLVSDLNEEIEKPKLRRELSGGKFVHLSEFMETANKRREQSGRKLLDLSALVGMTFKVATDSNKNK